MLVTVKEILNIVQRLLLMGTKKDVGVCTLLIPNAGLGEAYQKDKQRS